MAWLPPSEDDRPLLHFRGHPVHAPLFLVGLHVIATITCSLLQGFHRGDWIQTLTFSNQAVFREYHLWKLITYPLVHFPTFSFLFSMLILFQFGKILEQFLGRNSFLIFYTSLALLPALILTILAPWTNASLEGAFYLHFALMVACATIEPQGEVATFWVILSLKWLTLILFSLFALQEIASNHWIGLAQLVLTCAIAYQGARWFVEGTHPVQDLIEKMTPKKVEPLPTVTHESPRNEITENIDNILEKISKSGIKSLTTSEKAALEKARLDLLNKERR